MATFRRGTASPDPGSTATFLTARRVVSALSTPGTAYRAGAPQRRYRHE
ncbi:hypothetical protein VXC91_31470 [Streptomyces chiangmaiensis]|uniref:Uncharacterized protein n=1 Tax=Streptomyces chiangmaiensis TaxID=766497 RepID=A0ABU7FQL2_9ACTN|nr:hypothetical protein [Streptomyces chiangmaiensis]MED7826349.1 hypothetical protein [Streptomyces chiangmaiensis]